MSIKKEAAASKTNKIAAMGLGSSLDNRGPWQNSMTPFEKSAVRGQPRRGDQTNYTCDGASAKSRLDRSAYARGGKVGGKGKTTVNVIIAPQGQGQGGAGAGPAVPPGPPVGAAPPMPPRPPMPPPGAMPPPGGMPLGAPPPGMPRKRGGRVTRASGGPAKYERASQGGAAGFADMDVDTQGRKRGGRVIKDGAGSGPGRLEKIRAYGKRAGKGK